MKKLASLSVFFPTYNDGKITPYLIAITYAVLPQVAKKFEVIIVDDGSTDETPEVLSYLKKYYPGLRVITHIKNRGYGGALKSGFKHAKYEWIFYTDGDGQYDTKEIASLVHKVSEKVDVINGYKIKRSDMPLRIFIGALYNKILQRLYKLPIRDIDCDFRLIRSSLVKNLQLTSNSGMICLELIEKLSRQHAKFREVPVHHYPRIIGHSQFFRPSHLIKTLQENIGYYMHRHD